MEPHSQETERLASILHLAASLHATPCLPHILTLNIDSLVLSRRGAQRLRSLSFILLFLVFMIVSLSILNWPQTCTLSLSSFIPSLSFPVIPCQWIMIELYLSKILTMTLQYMYVLPSYVMFFLLKRCSRSRARLDVQGRKISVKTCDKKCVGWKWRSAIPY